MITCAGITIHNRVCNALENDSVVSFVCSSNDIAILVQGTLFRFSSHLINTLINRLLGVATYDQCVKIQHVVRVV